MKLQQIAYGQKMRNYDYRQYSNSNADFYMCGVGQQALFRAKDGFASDGETTDAPSRTEKNNMIITNHEPDEEAVAYEAAVEKLTEAFNQRCTTHQLGYCDNGYFVLNGERLDDFQKFESATVLPTGVTYVFELDAERALQLLADDFEPLLVIACCRG